MPERRLRFALGEVEALLEEFEQPKASVRLQFRREHDALAPSGIHPKPLPAGRLPHASAR